MRLEIDPITMASNYDVAVNRTSVNITILNLHIQDHYSRCQENKVLTAFWPGARWPPDDRAFWPRFDHTLTTLWPRLAFCQLLPILGAKRIFWFVRGGGGRRVMISACLYGTLMTFIFRGNWLAAPANQTNACHGCVIIVHVAHNSYTRVTELREGTRLGIQSR